MKKDTVKAIRIHKILDALDGYYGKDVRCSLTYETPWQLLIATILSAQCTDERVNLVTKDLFIKYPSIHAFAEADLLTMEQDIHSIGFFHNKAVNIIKCCSQLETEFHGEVPSTMEELTTLAGVGRKTANVILGNVYGKPSIVVDTHVKRISRKLGITNTDDPTKAEMALYKALPEDHWILYNMQLITFGREICKAPNPKCEICFLQAFCPEYEKKIKRAVKTETKMGAKNGKTK